MSMLNIHAEALSSVNEAFHTFLLKYRRQGEAVYGVVEGKDDPLFYRTAIERFLPEGWKIEIFVAGNRQKVIDFFNWIDWSKYSRRRIAFFIDRDLADYGLCVLPDELNIYVTDHYSIENHIFTFETFWRVLIDAYNVADATPDDEAQIRNAFTAGLIRYKNSLLPIMAQILAWRRAGVRANIGNLDLSALFSFQNGMLILNPDYEAEESRLAHLSNCCGAEISDDEDLQDARAIFESVPHYLDLVRGKYLTWFFASILRNVHQSISQFVPSYNQPPKTRLPVGATNVMVLAGPRARIPVSLRQFIDRTFLAIDTTQAE
ncbi:DUF4435 domain-containing protein [Sphingobium lignivorans]|uniref:DUF4435 domain-containing protein n=1 Tax=Sphingobium lignivorans TaxID=2735886 RepID=A0ABR6NJ97_9SPHN|nr:DUF4435 domain-containing protein [Sphingobium lignivorans]MBB5987341.1 hypothetical protein [Sphingobium lignivorans]